MYLPSSAKPAYPLLFLAIVLLAIALRAPDLTRRPMHTDAAVRALKFGMLLEDGVYRYDRTEYHGPTLNYLTLIPAWAESAERLAEIDETTLRIVPVVFGIGLVLLLPLFAPGLGREAVVVAGFLTAVSPAMVFYSRYYVQEMLLVFFSFAVLVCGYRYTREMRVGWAVATGTFLGLMHATKETAIIVVACMALALGLTLVTRGAHLLPRDRGARATLWRHGAIGLATAVSVSALLYSSFFTNPAGIIDSYLTYASYFSRASHEWHLHPWHYYLRMLLYFRGPSGPVWSEALIVLLAGLGIGAAATRTKVRGVDPDALRFLCFYTVALLLVYSAIPYKTPWNMLGALHGMIILAGVGAAAVLGSRRRRYAVVFAGVLIIGGVHLMGQSYRATHAYDADPANPYVYAHPQQDVVRIAERVQALADAHPDGNNIYIEVISPASDYWPLPWYLRSFPNTGWWDEVDMGVPAAPVILAAPSVEAAVLEKLYELPPPGEKYLYVPLFESYTEIRPTVEIRGYVTKELWDNYRQQDDTPSTNDAADGQTDEGTTA